MSWTQSVVWKSENPELFAEIQEEDKKHTGGKSKFGRVYPHMSLGLDSTNERYISSLERDIAVVGPCSYAETLKEDLRLHRAALKRNDQCWQLVDCSNPKEIA